MDCSLLPSTTNATLYVAVLRNLTAGNLGEVERCKAEVCSALFGRGNPDISGIGMAIGYVFEAFLGLALTAIFLFDQDATPNEQSQRSPLSEFLVTRMVENFFSSAIFFTLWIHIADSVLSGRTRSGYGMGELSKPSMQIDWVASSLTLIAPTLMVDLRKREKFKYNLETLEGNHDHQDKISRDLDKFREFLVHGLICGLCTAYQFLYTMIYFQSKIGDVSDHNVSARDICFQNVQQVTRGQNIFIMTVTIGTAALCFTLFLNESMRRLLSSPKNRQNASAIWSCVPIPYRSYARIAVWIAAAFLAMSLLWAFFRLRNVQKAMVVTTGGDYADSTWSFGQVVGALVFVPVLFDCIPLLPKAKPIWTALRDGLKYGIGMLSKLMRLCVAGLRALLGCVHDLFH